jgi:AraC-like DNA-binding protein
MPDRPNTERPARARVPASLFDTSALPAPERFAAWRESVGVFLDTRPPATGLSPDFNARVESYLLDDVVLARSTISAQKFDRGSLRIAQDSIDHYMIQLFMAGSMEMKLGRQSFRLATGGLIAFDLAETMDTFDEDCDVLCIVIPRRRLAPILAKPDSQQGTRVDPQAGSGLLLANYMTTLFSIAPTLAPAEASLAARSLIDLVALAFNGATLKSGELPKLAEQAQLLRAQNFIKERLPMPQLGPSLVAEGLGMSRAQLYRLFAPVGGVAEYIREQRLRRCLADLLSAHRAHRQVADIAYGWGFADPTYFAKAFKQRFNRTPSEARAAGVPQAREARGDLGEGIGDRLYEEWVAGLA